MRSIGGTSEVLAHEKTFPQSKVGPSDGQGAAMKRRKVDEQETKVDEQETRVDEQETKVDEQEMKGDEQETKVDKREMKVDVQGMMTRMKMKRKEAASISGQSAVATRVKKQRVIEGGVIMEPCLKRAKRQSRGGDVVAGEAGSSKAKGKQREMSSSSKTRGRMRRATTIKWPVKNTGEDYHDVSCVSFDSHSKCLGAD
jgi:hypothetical protein